ncbi:MAG TPA: hypothetical protein VFS97_04925 [Nitrososphaeraceae archaeon]|nr:hypothetical protein [Nitrososphaeraceae archaeon]
MIIDDTTKRFIISRLKWLGFYMGVSFFLIFLLPYPYGFISIFGLLVLVNYLRIRSTLKRSGGTGRIKDMFSSLSSPMSGNNQGLKYYCMGCGREHREIACPNCGSKMKRVG